MDQPIFTLEARGNVFLEVMRDYFGLDRAQIFREINANFLGLLQVLKAKQIEYASLKNALIPRPDRSEVAFVFDSADIDSNWYGYEIFDRLLPALDKRGVHSVLCGDYTGEARIQGKLRMELLANVVLNRQVNWKHSSQYFLVYINNLSRFMVAELTRALSPYKAFVGYAECNFPSFFKTYLSMILVSGFVKAGRYVIQGHEDDRPDEDDVNMTGYPFEENGNTCRSVQSSLYDLFLTYKIERAVYPGFESDTLFSLNSISSSVVPLEDCELDLEESKLKYLVEKKYDSLKRSGFINFARHEIETKIRERLANNYIFNLTYIEAYQTMKFNTVLNMALDGPEVVAKLLVALEYKPAKKRLRVVTMF
jgi:hypothetical protein